MRSTTVLAACVLGLSAFGPVAAVAPRALGGPVSVAEPVAAAAQRTRVIRAGRLREWVTAVEEHELGTDDAAVVRLQSWPVADVQHVLDVLPAVLHLVVNPDTSRNTSFWSRRVSVLPELVRYDPRDFATFEQVAQETASRGDFNRLIKRAAFLYTDAAFWELGVGLEAGAGRGSTFVVSFADGQGAGSGTTDSPWTIARALLDLVQGDDDGSGRAPEADPAGDADVRAWYRGTLSLMLARRSYVARHFESALDLFPDDAEVLFLGGSFHARLATPDMQQVLRSARAPQGVRISIESPRNELRRAESLFRRSLEADPDQPEARLRLGRVLMLLDRQADAVAELRAALDATNDPLLRYYGSLLLGELAESDGDLGLATRLYQGARALFPRAQSPRLALSQLAFREDGVGASADHLDVALAETDGTNDSDPWWMYHSAAGRDALVRLQALYTSFAEASAR